MHGLPQAKSNLGHERRTGPVSGFRWM